jgi:predicted transcriptional regulator
LDYKEDLLKLKLFFKVTSNKELAEKLDLTESAVSEWVKRKVIPKKYLKIVQKENNNQEISTNNGNNIQIENNHGHININSSDEMSMEICKEIKKLSDVKKEYYYHLIKADVLREQIGN